MEEIHQLKNFALKSQKFNFALPLSNNTKANDCGVRKVAFRDFLATEKLSKRVNKILNMPMYGSFLTQRQMCGG